MRASCVYWMHRPKTKLTLRAQQWLFSRHWEEVGRLTQRIQAQLPSWVTHSYRRSKWCTQTRLLIPSVEAMGVSGRSAVASRSALMNTSINWKNMPIMISPRLHHASGNTLNMVLVTALLTLCLTAPSHGAGNPPDQPAPSLSRAEVVADLALWRRAGVDRYAQLLSYGPDTEEYRSAYQEYLRLRNSEEFQQEVLKYWSQ